MRICCIQVKWTKSTQSTGSKKGKWITKCKDNHQQYKDKFPTVPTQLTKIMLNTVQNFGQPVLACTQT